MARYDNIYGAGNVTVEAPPDFWTAAKQSFDDDYDRLVAAQTRQEEKDRYDSEKFEEQKRYNTEQENLMFQQKYDRAVAAHQAAVADYTLASEQIGPENPEMQAKLDKQYFKEYRVPTRDGGYETRRVVPQAVLDYNDVQVQSKKDFDFILSQWDDNLLTNEQKIAAWPQIKRLNRVFNEQLEPYEASYKRALSYNDNKTLLDSMGAFLPAGYGTDKWDAAKTILLKDGEVSESELKLVASDISTHIANKKDAREFWTKFSSDIIKARADLEPGADATTIRDLQGLSDKALEALDEWYPMISDAPSGGGVLSEEEIQQQADALANNLYGKPYDDLDSDEQNDVKNQIIEAAKSGQPIKAAIVDTKEKEVKEPKKLHDVRRTGIISRTGPPIKDPVSKNYMPPASLGKLVNANPFKYAKAGLVPSKDWPGFKDVGVKDAITQYQKPKSLDMESVLKEKRKQVQAKPKKQKKKFTFKQPGVPDAWLEPAD
jgi:hypothetical protein